MKANELMIDDWVLWKDKPVQVSGVVYSFGQIDVTLAHCGNGVLETHDIKSISPIPLTQEILKKNGFGSLTDEMFSAYETETYSNQELKIYLSHIGCEYNPVQLVVYMGYEPQERVVLRMMPCQYVHELQHAFRLCKIKKEIKL